MRGGVTQEQQSENGVCIKQPFFSFCACTQLFSLNQEQDQATCKHALRRRKRRLHNNAAMATHPGPWPSGEGAAGSRPPRPPPSPEAGSAGTEAITHHHQPLVAQDVSMAQRPSPSSTGERNSSNGSDVRRAADNETSVGPLKVQTKKCCVRPTESRLTSTVNTKIMGTKAVITARRVTLSWQKSNI